MAIIHLDFLFFLSSISLRALESELYRFTASSKRKKVALSGQGEDFNWTFKALLVSNWDLPLSYCAFVASPTSADAISSVISRAAADVIVTAVGVSGLRY